MKEICEKNNMISCEIESLINIAATYYLKQEYEMSLQFFIQTLKKCKRYDMNSLFLIVTSSIANVYLKLGDYDNAYKYYELCNSELEKYPYQGKNLRRFYLLASNINFKLGDLDKAKFYINQVLKLYENDDSIKKWQALILNENIKIRSKDK